MRQPLIAVAGGGVGGVTAARLLASKLREHGESARVVLVTDKDRHYIPPLFLDVAIGEVSPGKTWIPLDRYSRRHGVEVIVDPIVRIDAAERRLRLASGRALDYDYLVVSLGSTMEWSRYPGLAEAGVHNYSLEGALEMRRALAALKDGSTVLVLVPEIPYRCGIYPVEITTILAEKFRSEGRRINIKILSPGPAPMPGLGPDLQSMIKEAFDSYGIEYVEHKGLEEVDAGRRLVRASNVEERFDLLIKVPPPGLPEPLRNSEGFTLESDPRWAPAKAPLFRHPKHSEVYMIGEHSMPPTGLSLAGTFIHSAAMVATAAILDEIIGFAPVHSLPPTVCAGYLGRGGFMGVCEPSYNPETGKYKWKKKCYKSLVGPLVALFKLGFYRLWLNMLVG